MRHFVTLLCIFVVLVYFSEPQRKTVITQLDIASAIEAHLIKEREPYVRVITKKYNIDPVLADEIVRAAYSNSDKNFPTVKDLLAVIGIESSFNPRAKSHLKKDPARGLMQVRPGVWGLSASGHLTEHPLHDIEFNIKHGAYILSHYHRKLGRRENALMAYNVGITAFLEGERNEQYLEKYHREVALYRFQ